MEVWLQNYFNIVIPYRNIYKQAKQVLNEDNDIKILLVTAGPFTLFKFGNKLHRRCGIPWVADYRDEWSTNVITRSHTIPERFIRWVESHSEKRWLKSASKIITVSEPIAKRIQQYTGIPAEVVLNGFDEKIYNHKEYDLYDEFTITYNGTLYSIQPYQIFLEAFKRIVDRFKSTIAIRIRFPGLDHDEKMGAEIREYLRGYEENYEISGRTTKEAMAEIQGRSHCLLSISYTGSSGFYSTKLFEYLASGRPVILCPGDHDVMEKLITEAKAGYICNSSDEAFVRMKQLIDDYVQNKITRRNPDWAVISEYSRRKQTEILSQILEKMLR
jgi:glycosyltransferase involved in cell wall biosynthesis